MKIQIMHRCSDIIFGASKPLLSMVFIEDVLQLVHMELEIICVSLMLAERLSYLSSRNANIDDVGNKMKTEYIISIAVTKEHVKTISEVTEVANLC